MRQQPLVFRSIYLTRHGESEYNKIGRLGGDSPLSVNGLSYAGKLREYFEQEDIQDLRIWSSQKIRAAQTANHLKDLAAHVEYWKVLDEIDAVSWIFEAKNRFRAFVKD